MLPTIGETLAGQAASRLVQGAYDWGSDWLTAKYKEAEALAGDFARRKATEYLNIIGDRTRNVLNRKQGDLARRALPGIIIIIIIDLLQALLFAYLCCPAPKSNSATSRSGSFRGNPTPWSKLPGPSGRRRIFKRSNGGRRFGSRKFRVPFRRFGRKQVRFAKSAKFGKRRFAIRRSRFASRSRSKAIRKRSRVPRNIREPRRALQASYDPADTYRNFWFGISTQSALGFKSPLQVLTQQISATQLTNILVSAGAEFSRHWTIGSNANAKYPTGLMIKAALTLNFFPVYQANGYVRLYRFRTKAWPHADGRVFSSDYTASVQNEGVPQTFEYNDSGGTLEPATASTGAKITVINSTNQTYFHLPWVSIKENKQLQQNWSFKLLKTFKIGPGLPVKRFVFKTGLRHYNYAELNEAGAATPQAQPKFLNYYVIETVGENVVMDNVAAGGSADAKIFYGPCVWAVGYKMQEEFAYRPTFTNLPDVQTSINNMGVMNATWNPPTTDIKSVWGNYYNALAVPAGGYPFLSHEAGRFGVAANSAQHPTQPAIVGTNNYNVNSLMDINPFLSTAIRAPNMLASGGNFDHGSTDSLVSAVANAVKTAAT